MCDGGGSALPTGGAVIINALSGWLPGLKGGWVSRKALTHLEPKQPLNQETRISPGMPGVALCKDACQNFVYLSLWLVRERSACCAVVVFVVSGLGFTYFTSVTLEEESQGSEIQRNAQ